MAVLLGAGALAAHAAAPELAFLAPADAKAFIETVDAAGLRQMLLESRFWAALENTQAFKDWHASDKYAQMQQRIEELLGNLKMNRDEALKTYLGGRSAVVLLASEDRKKPDGVLLIEATATNADRFFKAVGAAETHKILGVPVYEVRKDNRIDLLAYSGGAMLMTANGDAALERVLDVIVNKGQALGATGQFAQVTRSLPKAWRMRAFAAETHPNKQPGAVSMYPQDNGRLHFEWRLGAVPEELPINQPAVLTGPKALPDKAVAAVSTVFHPAAIWDLIKTKLAADPIGAEKQRKAEMFVRGWFPGYTMDQVINAFGPEAALALLKGNDGGAPGLLGLVRLTATGRPVAQAFKDGLAAKAMILASLGDPKKEGQPKLNVREEGYNNASILVIEAPGVLEKFLGDWAKDVALTVAVTDQWLVVGTSVSGIKQTLNTAGGNGTNLATAMEQQGETVPAGPVTRWGVICPSSGADIVLAFAEKLAGRERVEQAKKLINLAELLKLVKRFSWERTDGQDLVRGRADIQATN
jgi:hypothetical protein